MKTWYNDATMRFKMEREERTNVRVLSRESVIRHLTPTALALLSVELAESNCEMTQEERRFLDDVNEALDAIVGPEDAEQHRKWCYENI